ncbi:arachidonate 5-lipoxygenase-activating protein isoform X7 [Neofelis nebulosa]|uniref:arachidonate 5-lipoxygenase-activating protein isoform X7 n=1 Tax=Neofelis nebulosa TaxID=61452 RepID=UPI00272A2A3A|nr:arachidonate 5-lipoxygenase-activating protein isoform X7 [Neofelis nebulosa]
MDQETVGNIVLLAIVTLISVVQNGFFAHKVEHESKTQNGRSFQRTGTLAFERVYTANSRRLCWPDVPVREAKILRRLPGGENSEQINGTQHRTRRDNSRSVAFLGSLSHLPVGLVLPSDLPQHPLNISTAANPYYNGKMFISVCRPVPLNH